MHKQALVRFAEIATGFDDNERLKLILFASGIKPSTYIILRVNPNNLSEKYRFEKRLEDLGIVFVASRLHAYEEIDKIVKNKIIWKIQGVWIGYDLFQNKKGLIDFKKYVTAVRKHKHKESDKVAGKLYGYPSCCVKEYIKEQNKDYLKKKCSYYQYYKNLHDVERKFPFIINTACSVKCKESSKLNTKYKNAVKKFAPMFYKKFSKKKVYTTDLIVDTPSDIFKNNRSIWPAKDGFEYTVIAKNTFNKHHYIYTHLTKKFYDFGTVLDAKVTMQYRFADIKVKKVKREIKNLMHIRKFFVIGRSY